jgi:RND superfamily putative drug exporter
LYRIGRFTFRHRRLVIFVWSLVLVACVSAGLGFSRGSSTATTVPGTEAQQAMDTLARTFPAANTSTGEIVFHTAGAEVTAHRAEIHSVAERASHVPGVRGESPVAWSRDGHSAYIALEFPSNGATAGQQAAVQKIAKSHDMTVAVGGEAFQNDSVGGVVSPGAILGLFVTLGVLLFVFRSFRTAVLPLLTGLVGVAIGVMGLEAVSGAVAMDGTAPTLAVMLGLAVGVDYALFIVSRHQHQVRAGMDPAESAARAVGISGSAVVVAGVSVVIALAALSVVDIPFLTVMGAGAAATVAVSVLIAVTLLPALLGVLGDRVIGRRPRSSPGKRSWGMRWVCGVTRHRWSALTACVIALSVIAIPAMSLRLGSVSDTSSARASTMMTEGFGAGTGATLTLSLKGGDTKTAVTRMDAALRRLPDVTSVGSATYDRAGDVAMLTVTPDSGASSARTQALVRAIRHVRDGVELATRSQIAVTGTTAIGIDVAAKLSSALPIYCAIVVGLAMLLLLLIFRSVAVPLKAVVGFLLSTASALGAVVAVFQWGWLRDLFGIQTTGPLLSFLPMMLVGILFSLAMDYEVFIVSRMREEYSCGKRAIEAMQHGFGHATRVVTAAALIMVSVFGSFVFSDLQVVKPIAFALAIGVLIDAFVVRTVFIPAAMAVLEHRAWWLPRFLHRVLPNIDVEGWRLLRHLEPWRFHREPRRDRPATAAPRT